MTQDKFVKSVILKIPKFLNQLKDVNSNLYNFCLDGDLHTSIPLSSSVFVSKILYMLNTKDKDIFLNLNNHIIKFYKIKEKQIYDENIKKKSFIRRLSKSLVYRKFRYFSYYPSAAAETRQSLSALYCNNYKEKIQINYLSNFDEIINKIIKFDWEKPWHACSQLSHIIFFIKYFENNYDKILKILDFVDAHYRLDSGAWGKNDTISIQQKINGSMKMMTIFMLDKKLNKFDYKDKLIDLCLSSVNNKHACDNFNIICCLYNCSINNDYRKKEIYKFAHERLNLYKKYFHNEIGGFSFYINKSQNYYYDAKISKGNNTPDLQGTTLFLWGIIMISKILELDISNELQLPIT